jgi:OOP family OmpA-OmpF porin
MKTSVLQYLCVAILAVLLGVFIDCAASEEETEELKPGEVGESVVLPNIYFDFNKATLRPESYPELNKVVKLMDDYPTLKIEIGGHTDSVGTEAVNLKLSQDRAASVVKYLVDHAVSRDRLIAKGYGKSKPIESNATEEGRAKNRRIEFTVLEK